MFSIESPTTKLDSESDGKLGELEKMRETEFIGDVDATMGRCHQRGRKRSRKRIIAYSSAVWIWWFELVNELSMVKMAGYPAFCHEA